MAYKVINIIFITLFGIMTGSLSANYSYARKSNTFIVPVIFYKIGHTISGEIETIIITQDRKPTFFNFSGQIILFSWVL